MTRIQNLRTRAYSAQKHRCYYCNAPMWASNPDKFCGQHSLTPGEAKRFQCTAEHLTARQEGGRDTSSNIVAACRFCNATRHRHGNAKSPAAYKNHVRNRVNKGHWHPKPILKKIGLSACADVTST